MYAVGAAIGKIMTSLVVSTQMLIVCMSASRRRARSPGTVRASIPDH